MDKIYKFPYLYPLLTLMLGGLPFALYGIEQKLGILPTSEAWYATGSNHGPWRWELEGFTIYYPVIILGIFTLIAFMSRGSQEKKPSLIATGVFLVVLQVAVLV